MKTAGYPDLTIGPGRIAISRGLPRNQAGFKVYRALNPGPWFNSVAHDTYLKLYGEVLAKLDPQKTWGELHALVAPAEPILMCFEKRLDLLSGKTYCHRHQVAEWFKATLGHDVLELEPGPRTVKGPDGHLDLVCDKCKIVMIRRNGVGYYCPNCGAQGNLPLHPRE